MGFDIAVGASQAQLNGVGAVIYKQLYPQLFTGSVDVPSLGLKVAYDVQQAPAINLSPPPPALRAHVIDLLGHGLAEPEVVAAAADSMILFSLTAPQIALTLTAADGKTNKLTISATALCQADIDPTNGQVKLTALHVSIPQWTDPTVQWVLDNVVAPEVLRILNQYLAGVALPPLTIAGVALNVPLVVIQNAEMIAVTTLKGAAPPSPPPAGTPWPSAPFFALLSAAAADAAAAYQVQQLNPRFQDGGSAGWTIFSVNWGYNLTLGDPSIGIGSGSYHLGLRLSGGVNAGLGADFGIWKPHVDFGVGFTTNPDPGGSIGLSVNAGNTIVVNMQRVDAFGIALSIGGLPGWANAAIGWVTSTITNGLTSTLVPAVNAFIGRLSFGVFTIPNVTVNAGPVHVKVVPAGLRVSDFSGMVAATGELQVQPA